MALPLLTLTVLPSADGVTLPVGLVFSVDGDDVVVGRGDDVDVVVPDPTVSRRHARLRVRGGLEVERLTAHNGLFLDEEPVTGTVRIERPSARLQLGGVVLAVVLRPDVLGSGVTETARVCEPVGASDRQALWQVSWDAQHCAVSLEGQLLDAPPLALRALGVLLEHPGEAVHHWDLEERVGVGANLAQALSLARRAIKERLTPGRAVRLAEQVQAVLGTEVDPDDLDTLLRQVVHNRRGYGYLVCVSADAVHIERR